MSKKSATTQVFSINKSPLLVSFLLIIHSFAGFASLANELLWFYKLLFLMVVGSSLFFYLRRYHTRFQSYQLQYNDNGLWSMAIANNNFQTIKILPSSVVTIWLISLDFRLENGKRENVVIFSDALNTEDYRALLVSLKITQL